MRSVMTFSPLTQSSYHVYLYVFMYVCMYVPPDVTLNVQVSPTALYKPCTGTPVRVAEPVRTKGGR